MTTSSAISDENVVTYAPGAAKMNIYGVTYDENVVNITVSTFQQSNQLSNKIRGLDNGTVKTKIDTLKRVDSNEQWIHKRLSFETMIQINKAQAICIYTNIF